MSYSRFKNSSMINTQSFKNLHELQNKFIKMKILTIVKHNIYWASFIYNGQIYKVRIILDDFNFDFFKSVELKEKLQFLNNKIVNVKCKDCQGNDLICDVYYKNKPIDNKLKFIHQI